MGPPPNWLYFPLHEHPVHYGPVRNGAPSFPTEIAGIRQQLSPSCHWAFSDHHDDVAVGSLLPHANCYRRTRDHYCTLRGIIRNGVPLLHSGPRVFEPSLRTPWHTTKEHMGVVAWGTPQSTEYNSRYSFGVVAFFGLRIAKCGKISRV